MNNFYIIRKEVTKIWKNYVSKNQEKEIINLYAFTRNTFTNENVFFFFFFFCETQMLMTYQVINIIKIILRSVT